MPAPTLHGITLKLNRANEHLHILEVEIIAFLKGKMHKINEHTIFQGGQPLSSNPIYKIVDAPRTPDKWSVIIGDIAYNLRSCLDHLARQLAIMDNPATDPTKLARTEFPIFQSECGYANHAGKIIPTSGYRTVRGGLSKIGQLSARHQDMITDFQPYQGGLHTPNQPLWTLHQLRNIDAHQEIHTTVLDVELPEQPFTIVEPVSEGVWEVGFRNTQKNNVRRIQLAEGESLQLKTTVEGRFPSQVIFDQPTEPVIHRQDVLTLIYAMIHRVADVVSRFAPDFP